MKFLFSISLLLATSAFAKCNYKLNTNEATISWTAFKTPKKVGVGGKFDEIKLTSKDSSSLSELINSTSFEINTASVNTGNPERDKKITKFFFKTDSSPLKINGKVLNDKKDKVSALLKINSISKEVIFTKKIEDKKIILTSSIDVLDYKLNEHLSAINEACKALHEGKTWSDVDIRIEATYSENCSK